MARKQTIIVYPHLNNCNNDLSKQWYVELRWRIPGEIEMRKERVYEGMSIVPKAERLKAAKKVIKEKTAWLNSGEYLQGNLKKVYSDELLYRNEAKMYDHARAQVVTTRTNLSEFLTVKKEEVNKKSYQDYVSKMRTFNAWLKQNNYDVLAIKNITRDHIIAFSVYLSSEKKLARATIKKYIQVVHGFFKFEVKRRTIMSNPAEDIPTMGAIVDCAAVPFIEDDRARLKAAISLKDPQLWLACEIQYYCAIRPGTELRLMKLKWIDFNHAKFRVPSPEAKNDKTELVYIPDFLIKEMKAQELHTYKDKELYVFGKFGRPGDIPLGKNTMRNRFNRYREELKIPAEHKFYSWKHTGAISLLENGAQPYDIKNHLRHASFVTTEKYLRKQTGNSGNKISPFTTEI